MSLDYQQEIDALEAALGAADLATTDKVQGKIGTDTQMADRSLYDLLNGDGPASFPNAAVPANDVSTNEVLRDVWGSLCGTAAGNNGVQTFPSAAVPANGVSLAEVIRDIWAGIGGTAAGENGIQTYPAAAAPANNVSLSEVLRYVFNMTDKVISNTAAVLVNGTTIFTIANGPIAVLELMAYCVTANDPTESTLRWSHDPTDGAATTISGASASLVSAAAGASVVLQGTALTTAPTVTANGAVLGQTREIILMPGIITTTIGVGSTTGTWRHHLRYRPLSESAIVS